MRLLRISREGRLELKMKKTILLALVFLTMMGAGTMKIRESCVAGKFYVNDSTKLARGVEIFLGEAVPQKGVKPRGLILPHAGWAFSGQIAADGFSQAASFSYDAVVILGTNHTVYPSNRLYFHDGDAFKIPLGLLYIDKELQKKIMSRCEGSEFNAAAHQREHSIEVQLPFIKKIFGDVRIVPVIVGSSDAAFAEEAGKALGKALAGRNALVIASSDLSHYPGYAAARRSDIEAMKSFLSMDAGKIAATMKKCETSPGVETAACGAGPITMLVSAMKEMGAEKAVALSYANSGDTVMGDTSKVVGYGAVMFSEGSASADSTVLDEKPREVGAFGEADKQELLKLARRSIRDYIEGEVFTLPRINGGALSRKQSAFVTLTKKGDLRGCIGHMAEDTPLGIVVAKMALAAAFDDDRFYPLQQSEFKDIEIEISVLTPLKQVSGPTDIVIGRDGTVIEKGGRRAVFLPQVAPEEEWSRDEMLQHLCAKAGLPEDCYKSGCKFYTFQAIVFKEK